MLNGQPCGDGVVDAMMEYAQGSAALSKVGLRICTDNCVPKYYTVRENNYGRMKITVTPSFISSPCNYTLPPVNTAQFEYYTSTLKYDKFLNSLGVQREGCGGSPLQTSIGGDAGRYSYSYYTSCTSTAPPGGPWSNPGCFDGSSPPQLDLNGATSTIVDTCTFVGERWNIPIFTQVNGGCVLFTRNQEYETGTSYSNEFTTGELKSVLDSRATARIPGVFAVGPAITLRELNNSEDCAAAADTKFRIRIEDYVPRQWYQIRWHVVKLHWNGALEHFTPSVKQRAPASGDFFFPSASGRLIVRPGWPPGACNQGGGEYTIYYKPTATAIED